MVIESKDNKRIKYIKKLMLNKYISEEKKFIIEGKHLVNEAYLSGILLETYSTSDEDFGVPNTIITEDVMKYLTNMKSSSSVIGVCKFCEEKKYGNKIIVLDDVQDPGNVGTIIRSSVSFDFDTIVLSMNSVNKYNDKLIRASQGMLFKTNVITKNTSDFITELKQNGYLVYATDVTNGTLANSVKKEEKLAIVMGNEGTGVSNKIKELCDKNIYIPINKNCESLNVAVAASIIMYEINKGSE